MFILCVVTLLGLPFPVVPLAEPVPDHVADQGDRGHEEETTALRGGDSGMDQNKVFGALIVVLLCVIACGVFFNSFNQSDETEYLPDYLELKARIDELNQKGGKVYFVNGNYNIIPSESNIVSLHGDTLVFEPHGDYKKFVGPVSGIAYFYINS